MCVFVGGCDHRLSLLHCLFTAMQELLFDGVQWKTHQGFYRDLCVSSYWCVRNIIACFLPCNLLALFIDKWFQRSLNRSDSTETLICPLFLSLFFFFQLVTLSFFFLSHSKCHSKSVEQKQKNLKKHILPFLLNFTFYMLPDWNTYTKMHKMQWVVVRVLLFSCSGVCFTIKVPLKLLFYLLV